MDCRAEGPRPSSLPGTGCGVVVRRRAQGRGEGGSRRQGGFSERGSASSLRRGVLFAGSLGKRQSWRRGCHGGRPGLPGGMPGRRPSGGGSAYASALRKGWGFGGRQRTARRPCPLGDTGALQATPAERGHAGAATTPARCGMRGQAGGPAVAARRKVRSRAALGQRMRIRRKAVAG